MNFPQAKARLEQAVFDRLGEDATWEGTADPVRIRCFVADEELRLGSGVVIQTGVTIKVRKSEVAAPQQDQQVQVLDESGSPLADGLFVVNGEPQLDRKGVWRCPARAA